MISKLVKYFGLFIIISFSAGSIFLSLTKRDLISDEYQALIGYTTFFEDRFFDMRSQLVIDREYQKDVINLVAIDDYSIKKIGRWPFPRDTYATLMDKLKHFGAKLVAYDVFFGEESLSCPGVSSDQTMAHAIVNFQEKEGNHVILPYSLNYNNYFPEENFQEMPEIMYNFMIDARANDGVALLPSWMEKKVFPIPLFSETEASMGHIEFIADTDGIFRHYPVVGYVDELYFPSFSLMAYQLFTGDKPKLELPSTEESLLKVQSGTMELNSRGEYKVRWLGGDGTYPQYAFYDVMTAHPDDPRMHEAFNNKMVFIASTAFGAHDFRHTPIDSMMPGIYIHLNMTDMLLKGHFYKPIKESTSKSWWMLILSSLAILIIMTFGNALIDLASVILLSAGLFLYDVYFLIPEGYQIKLFFCLFCIGACYSWNTFLHFYLANKDKAFLKSAFGNYISPELIDEMYSTGQPPELGGDSGIRTAYFTDIQGFSTFSEKLTATQLVELLNEYLTEMTDILLDEKGTLDKYEGDAIIAFFGAPMPLEDHASRACMVAHRMQMALLKLRKKWTAEGDKWPQIVHDMRMRIGINSGEIVTGNMGSKSRMNYTMMGDSVNLAARLEESAKQYGIFTQVSKETMEMTGKQFIWRELDTIKVVGKSVPVTTFDLLWTREECPEYLLELSEKFKSGIELYKAQIWDEAISVFRKTLELEWQRFPDLKDKKTNPSLEYIERCESYKQTPPPPDWDGVWTLTSK